MGRNDPRWAVKCSRTKRDGNPCGNWAIRGGTVCTHHGGRAPQIKAKAAERLKAKKLREHTGRRGKSIDKLVRDLEIVAADRGPTEILLDVVYRAHAMVQLLGAVVGRLTLPAVPVEAPDGVTVTVEVTEGLFGPDRHGEGRPHVAVAMYQEALSRAATAAKLAIDAGVSERLVRVEQEKGRMIAQLIGAVIDDPELGLDSDQRGVARRVAAGHLRVIAGG